MKAFLPLALAAALVLPSCASLGSEFFDNPDWLDSDVGDTTWFADDDSSSDTGDQVAEFLLRAAVTVLTTDDVSLQNEYALSRAYGAQVLSQFRPLDNSDLNRYVNLIGQNLGRLSDRPVTYSGYRFLVLDSKDADAFASPGGLIFITAGLVKTARNESELAAILAHEVAHVELRHGAAALKNQRLLEGLQKDANASFDSRQGGFDGLTALAANLAFDGAQTIFEKGYSRQNEFDADEAALRLLRRAGYPPQALVAALAALKKLPKDANFVWLRTHPSPQDRIDQVRAHLGKAAKAPVKEPLGRTLRFQAATAGL